MTKLIRLINTTIISSLFFATLSSQLAASNSTKVDTVESESTAVTTLEVIPISPTTVKVEIIAQTTVKIENITANQTATEEQLPTQITTETVKKIETELNAEKVPEGIRINVPETILFDFDKYNVRAQAKPTLTKINLLLRHYKNAQIFINGHTDNHGEDSYNLELSQKRSAAVKYYFINVFKVQNTRMQTKGYGKTKPISPNNNLDGSDNPTGREKNRRVELIIKT
ncbi:OmpA family protein [Microcoleus sp. CAWBG640]|uniref:OmpA family protein n=1 Tax=Microcoleus sp. CAWBG640 TaxID=2841653 RepID=UPI00312B8096